MRRLRFLPKSRADLLEIQAYIAEDDLRRARAFTAELQARYAGLVRHPFQGRPEPRLANDARRIVHGRYIILYRVTEAEVLIDRIVHGARDLGAVLDEPSDR